MSAARAPSSIIGTSACHTLPVWSSLIAVSWMIGVGRDRPTGSPAASHPAGNVGPSASAQIIAAPKGPLPHFCGRTS